MELYRHCNSEAIVCLLLHKVRSAMSRTPDQAPMTLLL